LSALATFDRRLASSSTMPTLGFVVPVAMGVLRQGTRPIQANTAGCPKAAAILGANLAGVNVGKSRQQKFESAPPRAS
jgi:hypothetical protein